MTNKTMGEMISTLRKEKGMTQKELADQLHITDKAVSKWEREVACPDTQTIPKLAEILGVSVEELMQGRAASGGKQKSADSAVTLALRAIPVAMGVAVAVLSVLGQLDSRSGFTMLGIGLACTGISLLERKD